MNTFKMVTISLLVLLAGYIAFRFINKPFSPQNGLSQSETMGQTQDKLNSSSHQLAYVLGGSIYENINQDIHPNATVWQSKDLITWTKSESFNDENIYPILDTIRDSNSIGIKFRDKTLLFVKHDYKGNINIIDFDSANLISEGRLNLGEDSRKPFVVVFEDKLYALRQKNTINQPNPGSFEIFTSHDGSNWFPFSSFELSNSKEIPTHFFEYNNKLWIVNSYTKYFWTSYDGVIWNGENVDIAVFDSWEGNGIQEIFVFQDKLFILTQTGNIYLSFDGISWQIIKNISSTENERSTYVEHYSPVVFNEKIYLINQIGGILNEKSSNDIWVSSNGREWDKQQLPEFLTNKFKYLIITE